MEFERLFEGKPWSATTERVGIMSVDSLGRQWVLVAEECGYLIAKSRDGKAGLLGRMCEREDGKSCIEVLVRAEIENSELRHYEFWYVDAADELRYARRLRELISGNIRDLQRDGDHRRRKTFNDGAGPGLRSSGRTCIRIRVCTNTSGRSGRRIRRSKARCFSSSA
ncbi:MULTISPECIES: hypothetical protein [Burkholderia]|uniref:hypothetical protein n=1 Tax=Burkholderia TaxID=32008 RepID=UPI001F401646|nr:hypothetical protein [Burkholderia sp. KCJ3K979]